ncbi:MAG: hypothetical protein WBQ13_12355 [Terriglobales bacterium]
MPKSVIGSFRSVLGKHPRLEWLIPTLLCTVMFGQLLLIGHQLSQTADEATHLYSGYRYLKCGDLTVSPEHPPLAKIVAAAPLLLMNEQVDCTPFQGSDVAQAFASLQWFYSQNWESKLFWTRMAVSVFAMGLCALVWIAARRMFGFGAAVVATLLVAFEPDVLASGALITTDLAVTTTLMFAVFVRTVAVRLRPRVRPTEKRARNARQQCKQHVMEKSVTKFTSRGDVAYALISRHARVRGPTLY